MILACRLSKPDQHVTWYKDDAPLSTTDEKYQMQTSACNYTMCIPKSSVDDTGMYKVTVGEVQSTATIIIYGKVLVLVV